MPIPAQCEFAAVAARTAEIGTLLKKTNRTPADEDRITQLQKDNDYCSAYSWPQEVGESLPAPEITRLKCSLPKAMGKNPLHDLKNYTYRLIISVLTTEEFNTFSSASGSMGEINVKTLPKPNTILIASGGENYEKKNEFGVQDFFFDELIINTTPSAPLENSVSFVTDLDFTLIEPIGTTLFERLYFAQKNSERLNYSYADEKAISERAKGMGGKAIKVEPAVIDQMYKDKNLSEYIFLLTIEFKGYKGYTRLTGSGSGKGSFDLNANSGIFNKKYHIPFVFADIDTDIYHSGTRYRCKAIPAVSQVFFAENQAAPAVISIDENIKLPVALEQVSTGYTSHYANAPSNTLRHKYKFRLIDDNEISPSNTEALAELQKLKETIFKGGAPADVSRLQFLGSQNPGRRVPGGQGGSGSFRPGAGPRYYFGHGTSAIEIIHQIMLRTEYITDIVNSARSGNATQGIWWYTIQSKMTIIAPSSNPHQEDEKLFEYIIEPFKVEVINDIEQREECDLMHSFRNYRYIFTGKNDDILRWDLTFDGFLYSLINYNEPPNNTAAPGQIIDAQNKFSFPTLSSINATGPATKKYRVDYFGVTNNNGNTGRTKNFQEMGNSSFMESLWRQNNSNQQLQVELEIIGDPEYLASFGKVEPARKPLTPQQQQQLQQRYNPLSPQFPTQSSLGQATNARQRAQTSANGAESGPDKKPIDPGSVHYIVGLEFKTPTDVNPIDFSYKGMKTATLSGVYALNEIKHVFKNGKFTQILKLWAVDNKCCPPDAKPEVLRPKVTNGGRSQGSPTRQPQQSGVGQRPFTAQPGAEDAQSPVNGIPILNDQFGTSRSGGARLHDGVDVAGNLGDPIKSVAAGTVTFAGSLPGYGYMVEIKHADGTITQYAHLQNPPSVSVNSTVTAGQQIGQMGNTAGANGQIDPNMGVHLHFAVMVPSSSPLASSSNQTVGVYDNNGRLIQTKAGSTGVTDIGTYKFVDPQLKYRFN